MRCSIEDTNITFEQLEKEFPKEIIDILKLLTHDKKTSYMDYIKKIKENTIAKKIKIADIIHNSDETRLDNITLKDLVRREKYKKALEFLKD